MALFYIIEFILDFPYPTLHGVRSGIVSIITLLLVRQKRVESRVNRNRENVAARPVWSTEFEYQCTILSITCKPAAAREIRDPKRNTCQQLEKFKRAWENYEVAAQLKDLKNPESNKERRAATLLTSLGSDALDILDGLAFDDETQRKNPDVILARLEQYCIGEVNESFERYNFNKRDQEPHESIDAYVSSLRRLAKTCNYGQLTDSLIRERIIAGIRDNTARKKLLQTQKLTLKQSIDIVRYLK